MRVVLVSLLLFVAGCKGGGSSGLAVSYFMVPPDICYDISSNINNGSTVSVYYDTAGDYVTFYYGDTNCVGSLGSTRENPNDVLANINGPVLGQNYGFLDYEPAYNSNGEAALIYTTD